MFDSDFSYDFYFRLLDAYAERFTIRPLRDFPAVGPTTYLRHDIDVCPQAALAMAEREAERGFSATYMFIPTSPLYRLSPDALEPFVRLGHEVALHFDYLTSGVRNPADTEELGEAVYKQFWKLNQMTGAPVRSISFHRPIPQFLRGPDCLFGRVNAYSATLMLNYQSDSAGRWRSGNPLELVPEGEVAQLLTHPIWWSDAHRPPSASLCDYFDRQGGGEDLDRRLAETVPGVVRG